MSAYQLEHGYYGTAKQPVRHPEIAAIAGGDALPVTSAERCIIDVIGAPYDDDF